MKNYLNLNIEDDIEKINEDTEIEYPQNIKTFLNR